MLAGVFLAVAVAPALSTPVRTTEPSVAAVIHEARERSRTFAELMEVVERSDVLVYLLRVRTLPHGMEGCLVPVSATIGYLKIFIVMGLPTDRLIVVLAHELQHVREVIESGIQIDERAIDRLFRRIGARQQGSVTGEQYETAAAQQVMTIVASELRASRVLRQR